MNVKKLSILRFYLQEEQIPSNRNDYNIFFIIICIIKNIQCRCYILIINITIKNDKFCCTYCIRKKKNCS